MAMSCTFDESLPRAVTAVRCLLPDVDAPDLRFVRDMTGQLHVVVPDAVDAAGLDALARRLKDDLGGYSGGSGAAMRRCDVLAGEALFAEPVLIVRIEDFPAHLIERRALGQDWIIQPAAPDRHPPRFVFYSLKGGVGRSTALLLWACRLANQGRKVLVVDLDLEAPGLGAQLLPADHQPRFGVLDWLVEDLNGGAELIDIRRMTAESPVIDAGLWVAPALGELANRYPENVIAKLARAYLEGVDDESGGAYAARLRRMVAELEARLRPDIVLLDSRAGLHETVAANLLHLDAEALLFAVDLPATWQGYRHLFAHLTQLAQSARTDDACATVAWRERFKMVHARADETAAAEDRFVSRSYSLWTDTLYDDVVPAPDGSAGEPFSFDQLDAAAPHWPCTILRDERFERFDPLESLSQVGEQAIRAAFAGFFEALDERLEAIAP